MTSKLLQTYSDWTLHVAGQEHNQALCDLFRSVHVKGALDMTQERDPDFFRLLDLHHAPRTTLATIDTSDTIYGCGSSVVWPGTFKGREVQTGYFCDLRLKPGHRGGRTLNECYRQFMKYLRETYNTEVMLTVIFDSNKRAVKALTGGAQSDKRKDQPVYRPVTPFEMISVQFTRKQAKPSRLIEHAQERDREELFTFLIEAQQRRLFGRTFTHELLQKRIVSWPDFTLHNFLIARNPTTGRIEGCLAPWNTKSFKRTRVLGYHGSMWWTRFGFDMAAKLFRFAPLPAPGKCFDFSFLTHFEVLNDRADVTHDLLLAAYDELRSKGEHFMSAFVPRGIGYESAFRRFTTNRTAMTLYGVHIPSSPYAQEDLRTLHPGFEMALS